MKAWNEFLDKYYPEANRADASVMYGYTVAQGLVHVLKRCGDDLTRENIMKQAASIKDLELGGLLPGVKVNTSATDFAPLSQLQLMRFKGETWERFGDILSGDIGGSPTGLQRRHSDATKEAASAAPPQGLFVAGSRQIVFNPAASPIKLKSTTLRTCAYKQKGRLECLLGISRLAIASAAFIMFAASGSGALAQKKYDTGATDTEIKIGNIMPYSGPASAYGIIGRTEAAYFKKINDAGGINGRKINFISL